jgi:DNA-binding NarL/FixJ family response regulator
VASSTIRVGIVDDHPLYLQGLASVVEEADDLALVGSAPSVYGLDAIVDHDAIDLVVLDLNLPTEPRGPAAIRHYQGRETRVLVVSSEDQRAPVMAMIRAGAGGYLTKMANADEIRAAIRAVHGGTLALTPTLAAFLIDETRKGGPALTEREREVLECVAQGDKDSEIAEQLCISKRTVQTHLDNIRTKLGLDNRAKLVRFAIEQGLVDPHKLRDP